MAHVTPVLVAQTGSLSSGVVTVSGSVTGFRTFAAALADGDTVDVVVRDAQGDQASYPGSTWDETAGTLTLGSQDVAAGTISDGSVTVWAASTVLGESKEATYTIADGASVDIDPANGPIQTWTLGANRTPTATNFEAGQSVKLRVADGTAYTITWTTIGVVWLFPSGGSASAPTLATSGYTHIELWKEGSTVYGAHIGDSAS